MKAMKKCLGISLAVFMLLGAANMAFADDGQAGMEKVYFSENFESPAYEQTTVLTRGDDVFNGWTAKNGSGASYTDDTVFALDKETDNQSLSLTRTAVTSSSGQVTFSKGFTEAVPSSEQVRLSFRLKKEPGAGNFVMSLGGAQWFFCTNGNRNYLMHGAYDSSNFTSHSYSDNTWHEVELLIDYSAKTFEYYIDGTAMTKGKTAGTADDNRVRSFSGSVNVGNLNQLSIYTWRNAEAGTANARFFFDDIQVSTLDDKKICELAAEKLAVPSVCNQNLNLPEAGYGGAEIKWESSDTDIISNDGTVSRGETGEIQTVILTAKVAKGGASVQYPFAVKVPPLSVYFYEDFENETTAGLLKNWAASTSGGNYEEVFRWTAEQETAVNRAAAVTRYRQAASSGNDSSYTLTKTFETPAPSGGVVSVKTKFLLEGHANALVRFGNSTKVSEFTIRTNTGDILLGGNHISGGAPTYLNASGGGSIALNTWHEIEFVIDMAQSRYDLYFDGAYRGNFSFINNTFDNASLDRVSMGLARTSGAIDKSVYYDDWTVALVDVPYAYSTVDFGFQNAQGNTCVYPETGGTLSSVTLKKHKAAERAVMLAAVYENNSLKSVSAPIDVSGAKINTDNTYTVSLPIASASAEIRAFVLNGTDTLKPLAMEKTYEKRSPLQLFVAGASMAENVAGSTSSKVVDGETVTYAREGWGMRIGGYFADGAVTVSNHAVGGRSTATFISEGRLAGALAKAQRGDFLFISFGHNDQGQNISIDDYKANLKLYSKTAKDKGVTPVFITPITRISTSAAEEDVFTVGDEGLGLYAAAMKEAAQECGDVCLDLYTAFNEVLKDQPYSAVRTYYVPKEIDGTHLSPAGAQKAAELIAQLLAQSGSAAGSLLK